MDEWVNFYLGACSQAEDADEGHCNPREAQLSAVYRALDGGDGVCLDGTTLEQYSLGW